MYLSDHQYSSFSLHLDEKDKKVESSEHAIDNFDYIAPDDPEKNNTAIVGFNGS